MSLCEKCTRRDSKAMRALESLTPGGSEFVDEVERCVEVIRWTRTSQMDTIVRLTREKHALEARVALLEALV